MLKQQDRTADSRWVRALPRTGRLLCTGLTAMLLTVGAALAASPPLMVTPGQFSVSATGAGTYSIPVAAPPGTSGVVPALSLNYSSQNGDGFVGLGWSLGGLSSITRCPRTLAQDSLHGGVNYDSGDRFCMDGQRLMLISGTYGADGSLYRTEIESFSKIVAHGSAGSGPSWFEVWTKAGMHIEFGHSVDSQALVVSASTSSPTSTARVWAVNKISDAVGNYLTVTYNCAPSSGACTDTDRISNGEIYPLEIDYTGNTAASLSPYNSVRFTYSSRSDVTPQYQAGGIVKSTVVLSHIKTYQGANVVQDYQLTYRAGTSTQRSRLISLAQCNNGGTCLPATTFGWQGGGSGLSLSTGITSSYTPGSTAIPGDWNGDGLTDEAGVLSSSCPPYSVYLATPGSFGFAPTTSFTLTNGASSYSSCQPFVPAQTIMGPDGSSYTLLQVAGNTGYSPPGPQQLFYLSLMSSTGNINLNSYYTALSNFFPAFAGDFDGNGIIDFILQDYTSYIFIGNTSGGFTMDGGHCCYTPATTTLLTSDFDGDGCTDLLGVPSSGGVGSLTYLCNPAVSTTSSPNTSGYVVTLGDFNGDGKTDMLLTSATTAGQLWLSTGTGFIQVSSSIPAGWTNVQVGDWNGDGRADLVLVPSSGADFAFYLSTGVGFAPALDSGGSPITLPSSAGGSITVADWSNDGASDVLLRTGAGDKFYLYNYSPELMTSVSNGIGSTTSVAYDRTNTGAPFYTKGTSTYPTQDMIGAQYVVREMDTSNGLGTCNPASSYANCYRKTYTYAGAKKDLLGRGFLGFSTVVATDLQTNIVQTTNYCTLFPLTGVIATDTKAHSGVVLSSVANQYNGIGGCGATPTSGVNVVQLTQAVSSGNDLNGAPLPTTTTSYTYDSYGNALTVNISVSYGASTSTKNTTNTYSNDTSNWFLGRLLTTSVNSIVGSSNMTRQSSFAYDAATGLLTQESIEPGVSTCNAGSSSCTLTTSYTYDAFGHRVTTTVYGTGITTRTSYAFYDSIGEFMTSAANALGQYEFWGYDARFGSPTSHTGPNSLTTTWGYDSFGRMTQEIRPDLTPTNGTQTNISYAYCSGSCPTYGQFYSRSEIDGPGGSPQVGPIGYAYFDMLSRGIANDAQGFDGSNIRVATAYDSNGRVQQTSRPYFVASASPAWTQFTYDDLGRVTRATFPDTSHSDYGFNGLTTTITNSLSQTTTTVKNSQGLNASVTDATSHTTSYVYDAFGDLLTVTDPVSNVITNTFDVRGNKTASHDPDMGSWTYAYDVLAELTSQTDAKSQTTSLTYDVLGRPLTRTETGLYSAWTYGTSAANHNVGQVIEAKACPTSACSSIVSDKTYGFDGVGRESQFNLQSQTDNYHYATTYNTSNGQIASVTYPSGYTINRNYGTTGFLTQLTEAGNLPVWTINARDAELHITSQTAGNKVITTQTFDPNTGLIQNQRAGGGAVASFDYSFDTIGNLTNRSDNSQPYTERFCYDSLNRLTNYNIGAACTGGNTASYDTIGNITAKSDVGNYSYPSSGSSSVRPHAVSSIAGTVDGLGNPIYSYDGNGNLTCVSSGSSCGGTVGRQISLTSFNMAASLTQGSTSLSLTYDDQHQRLQQASTVSGIITTAAYVNDSASGAMSQQITVGSGIATFVDYITIDGQIVAQRSVQYAGSPPWIATPSSPPPYSLPQWGNFYWGNVDPTTFNKKWNSFTWGTSTFGWSPQTWNNFSWQAAGLSGAVPWSGTAVIKWEYFNLDHLGSVAVITDQAGNVVQRLSYDAWGKQRNPNGSAVACGTITAPTARGFTNQEEMPTQCLVNLNARLYDASIGKFMVADTMVPDASNGQSYNRYAYVANNPLSFTDPTGHEEVVTVTAFRNNFSDYYWNTGLSAGPGYMNLGGFAGAQYGYNPNGTFNLNGVQGPIPTHIGGSQSGIPRRDQSAVDVPVGKKNANLSRAIANADGKRATANADAQGAKSGCTEANGVCGGNNSNADLVFALIPSPAAIEAVGTKLLSNLMGKTVEDAVPSTLARVIPNGIDATTLGRAGASDVFVTAPEDIAGMNSAQIAQRLSIPESPTGYQVLEFPTPAEGLASPVFRSEPGFVGGGYTAGGAREYILPNGPIPPGTIITGVLQ